MIWVFPLMLVLAINVRAQQNHDNDGYARHQHDDDATASHSFEDAQSWADRFEDPARDAWQFPDSVVATLVDRDGMVIVDIGSATGYFPVRFARACPNGRVIGADIEPDMVWFLNERCRREGIENLVSILAAPDDPHLPLAADLVFLCNTYHHIDNRIDYFTRLRDQMNPGGRVAVVDFRASSHKGPAHKLSPGDVESEMKKAGFALVGDYDFLPDQYFLVFKERSAD